MPTEFERPASGWNVGRSLVILTVSGVGVGRGEQADVLKCVVHDLVDLPEVIKSQRVLGMLVDTLSSIFSPVIQHDTPTCFSDF